MCLHHGSKGFGILHPVELLAVGAVVGIVDIAYHIAQDAESILPEVCQKIVPFFKFFPRQPAEEKRFPLGFLHQMPIFLPDSRAQLGQMLWVYGLEQGIQLVRIVNILLPPAVEGGVSCA